MLETFLSLLLAFAFGLGAPDHPSTEPQTFANTIINRISEHIAEVSAPDVDPTTLHSAGVANQPELPPQANSGNQEPQNDVNPQNHEENANKPDTSKKEAYNQQSGTYVGEVAGVAVEKAEPLVSCTELTNGECDENAEPQVEPTPPVPTITPIPTIIPEPIVLPIIEPCPPLPVTHGNLKVQTPEVICLE